MVSFGWFRVKLLGSRPWSKQKRPARPCLRLSGRTGLQSSAQGKKGREIEGWIPQFLQPLVKQALPPGGLGGGRLLIFWRFLGGFNNHLVLTPQVYGLICWAWTHFSGKLTHWVLLVGQSAQEVSSPERMELDSGSKNILVLWGTCGMFSPQVSNGRFSLLLTDISRTCQIY